MSETTATPSSQLPAPTTVRVLNVDIHDLTRPELLARLTDGVFFSPNVDVVMKLTKDAEFHRLFHRAEFRICDSAILKAATQFLGRPVREKIPGSDFLGEFCAHHRDNPGMRMFLLGAGPGVADKARANINARLGREVVVGGHSPSFGFEKKPEESERILEIIRASGATALAVGVGAPKQEKWIMAYRERLPEVRVFLAVGATIDFEAGNVPRAPTWMRAMALEWLFRLWKEPKRLWRRYLVDDLPFLWLVLKQRLGLYKPPFVE